MTTQTKTAHTHALGFCICGHGRADHKSDAVDLTGELGGCLMCGCEVFSASSIESAERIRQAAPEMLEALEQASIALRYPERVPDMRGVVHQVEAAIQKARGQQ